MMNSDTDLSSHKEQSMDAFALPADLIRACAVVLVILLHASVESYSGLSFSPFEADVYWWSTAIYTSISRPAVPLFILLTGTLLLQPIKINEAIGVFLRKRFTRIGYAFVFWTTVYFAWSHFIHNQALTLDYIIQGVLTGSYFHLWFFYLIIGLYLVTPILRVIVTYGGQKILRYFIVLWFMGVALVPLFELFTTYTFSPNVFIIGGWIGYFLLGVYLQKYKLRSNILFGLLLVGILLTVGGSWIMLFPYNYLQQYYFFYDSLSISVILSSIALFMLLSTLPKNLPGSHVPLISRLIKLISQNSLPIYLLQIIILESLQMGFLGFRISLRTINPVIEVPLITVITLFIALGLTLLMRRVPVLKRLIG